MGSFVLSEIRACALIGLSILPGCASLTFQSPASGGAVWHEIASSHFVVQTDAGADKARAWAQKYERIHAYFRQIAFPSAAEPAGMTHVVMFDDEAEYREIAPRLSSGFFDRRGGPTYDPHPTIVGFEDGDDERVTQIFQHELAHRFIAFLFPGAPVWLNEGLAEFHEVTRIEDGKVVIGGIPHGMRYLPDDGWVTWDQRGVYPLTELPSAASVRALSPEDFYAKSVGDEDLAEAAQHQHYLSAWALTHVLMLSSPERRARVFGYLHALAAGEPTTWERHFGAAETASLDATYRAFLERETTASARIALPSDPVVSATPRIMTAAEVHRLWAVTRSWGTESDRVLAQRDIEAAIHLEPKRAEGYVLRASFWLAQKKRDAASQDIERALELAPQDRNALLMRAGWMLKAQARKPGDERESPDLVTAFANLKVAAKTAEEFLLIAAYEGLRGRFEQASGYAARAIRADSSCWEAYWIGAEIEFARGRSDAAAKVMRVALSLGSEEGAHQLLPRLREFEAADAECKKDAARCGPKPFKVFIRAD